MRGPRTGLLTGCSLRCVWCDSAYAFHGGTARTPEGIMVTSENGIGPDAYATEVILNGNTLEGSIDQYLSMILERELAAELLARADELSERRQARGMGVDSSALVSARHHRVRPKERHAPREIVRRICEARDAVEALRELASQQRAPADLVEALSC